MQKTKTRANSETREDRSVKVHQKKKLENPLNIRELNWTEKQKAFIDLALNNKTQVMIVKGPAGSSKTVISIYLILKLLSEKKISDITLVRSIVESADSKMGYLPGSSDDKMQPYMMPFYEKLDMLLSKQEIKNLEAEERITCQPVGFLRGLDFQVKGLCLDEAQNLNTKEILTFMSRIGRFCKTFICGDPDQSDVKNSGFDSVYNLFNNEESKNQGIYCWEFTEEDIMRSDLCKFITKKFKEISHADKTIKLKDKSFNINLGGEISEYSPSDKFSNK